MTKKELIALLITYPDNTEIVLEDPYSDSYWQLGFVESGYYNFDECKYSEEPKEGYDKAIVLSYHD